MFAALAGYRTVIAMGLALVVALWQTFVGPLPVIDPQMWNIAVPAVALLLRAVTKSAIGQKPQQ